MAQQVVMGASLMCSFGTASVPMTVTPEKMVTVTYLPTANIMDFTPMKNIMTFGMCSAPTNPAVIAATSAALGVFTPAPCIPNTATPWTPGAAKVKIKNFPALSSASTCQCMWLGTITVSNAGQAKVNVT